MYNKHRKIDLSQPCPVRDVLDRIGDKWATLVIITLGDFGMLRFNQLHDAIGDISQKMLTVTLRKLEEDGLVSRKMYAEIPPRVEYTLTSAGQSLLPHIHGLAAWAKEHMKTINKARKRYTAAV